MNNNQKKTSRHIVAFIDILGAKFYMEKNQDEYLKIIHEIFEDVTREIEIINAVKIEKDTVQEILRNKIKIKIFSDNILLAIDIEKKEKCKICFDIVKLYLLNFVAMLQWRFAWEGIMIRGGIVLGQLYSDNIMVWGDGLQRAYELESNNAIYPRVIVSDEIVRLSQPGAYPCDSDGVYYMDFISHLHIEKSQEKEIYLIASYYDDVESEKNIKVRQKKQWFKNYIEKSIKTLEWEVNGPLNKGEHNEQTTISK